MVDIPKHWEFLPPLASQAPGIQGFGGRQGAGRHDAQSSAAVNGDEAQPRFERERNGGENRWKLRIYHEKWWKLRISHDFTMKHGGNIGFKRET